MRMLKYILKRLLIAIPVLFGITLLDFAMTCMAGSPLDALVGPRISQDAVAAKEIMLGLDKPFYVQYWIWLKQLMQGNMGYSMIPARRSDPGGVLCNDPRRSGFHRPRRQR